MPEEKIIELMRQGLQDVDSLDFKHRVNDVMAVISEEILTLEKLDSYPGVRQLVEQTLSNLENSNFEFW